MLCAHSAAAPCPSKKLGRRLPVSGQCIFVTPAPRGSPPIPRRTASRTGRHRPPRWCAPVSPWCSPAPRSACAPPSPDVWIRTRPSRSRGAASGALARAARRAREVARGGARAGRRDGDVSGHAEPAEPSPSPHVARIRSDALYMQEAVDQLRHQGQDAAGTHTPAISPLKPKPP